MRAAKSECLYVRSFVDVDRKFNNMFLTTCAIEVHSSLRTTYITKQSKFKGLLTHFRSCLTARHGLLQKETGQV